MTATRDRRSDQDTAPPGVPPEERPLLGSSRGLPWWGSLLLAVGLTLIGAIAEIQFSGAVGRVFEAACFIGCVAAVCFARRNSLFGPMVQPPLIMGIVGPVVMLLLDDHIGASLNSKLLAVANPLINSFPAMAVTTAVTLAIGIARVVWTRRQQRAQSPEASEERTKRAPKPARRDEPRAGGKQEGRKPGDRGTGARDGDKPTARKPPPAGRGTQPKPQPTADRSQDKRGSAAQRGESDQRRQSRGAPGQQRSGEQRTGNQRRGGPPERERGSQPRRNPPPERGGKNPRDRGTPGTSRKRDGGNGGRRSEPPPPARPRPEQQRKPRRGPRD